MSGHNCPGDDCKVCEARIEEIENPVPPADWGVGLDRRRLLPSAGAESWRSASCLENTHYDGLDDFARWLGRRPPCSVCAWGVEWDAESACDR